MALKELVKSVNKLQPITAKKEEDKVQEYILQGGSLTSESLSSSTRTGDHRMTLRIPQWLMAKVDEKRKERIGTISRNLWILEIIDKACKK